MDRVREEAVQGAQRVAVNSTLSVWRMQVTDAVNPALSLRRDTAANMVPLAAGEALAKAWVEV
jgi:hypothetical protein